MLNLDNLYVFKYSIQNAIIRSKKWKTAIPNKDITNINISNSYSKNIIPEIDLTCLVDYNTYYDILSDCDDLEISFSISYGSYPQKNYNPSSTTLQFTSKWLECKFKCTDKGYIYSRDVSDTALDKKDNNERNNDDTANLKKEIHLYLYDSEKLIKYRKNVSGVISGGFNDVMYYLFTNRNIDNILMTPIPSDDKHDYIIPYGDLGANIKFLNEIYGIYKSKYLIYMGIDRNYFIANHKVGETVSFGEFGHINIYIDGYDTEKGVSAISGCYKDLANDTYIIGSSDIAIDNIDTLRDFSSGGVITSAVYGSEERMNSVIGDFSVEKSFNVHNKLEHEQFVRDLQEGKRIIYITINNVDLSIITPNKKYHVSVNRQYYDSSYNIEGDYRMLSSHISLVNNGENTFSNSVVLALTKIER